MQEVAGSLWSIWFTFLHELNENDGQLGVCNFEVILKLVNLNIIIYIN